MQTVLHSLLGHDAHAGPNGEYHIRSLYLDDIYHTAHRQKMAGVEVRKKYRIRIYNCLDRHIALECKYKNGAYIYKKSVPLTVAEYEALCRGDFGPGESARLFAEDALRSGNPVVCVVDPGDFTDVGHYIILKSIDDRAMVEVYDPNSPERSARKWDIVRVLNQTAIAWVYSAA